MTQTLRDHKRHEALLIAEQQRRNRIAHQHELELAYQASRDPRPYTMQEQEMEYALVRVRKAS